MDGYEGLMVGKASWLKLSGGLGSCAQIFRNPG